MVKAKVAEERATPVYMYKKGHEVCEQEFYGYKVTHYITKPGLCFVMDEVGGNVNQKGDGNWGSAAVVQSRRTSCPKN